MVIYDLNECVNSNKNGLYGGASGSKDGIIFNNERWLVKYPKSTQSMDGVDISYTTSPVCEYLGSHIYQILGYEAHDTILGIRHGKLVVACKDFTDEKTMLAEIRTIKNHYNEILTDELGVEVESTGDAHNVDLYALMLHIRRNPILTSVGGAEERFFEQAIIDIYLNNSDRNNGNWGILRYSDGRADTLAPIYDNGGCLQDKISEEKAERILRDIPLAKKYACGTQTVYADENGRIFSAERFIKLRTEFPLLEDALCKVVPLIRTHQKEIESLIDDIPCTITDKTGKAYNVCGPQIKDLYKLQLNARLDCLLDKELQIINQDKNQSMENYDFSELLKEEQDDEKVIVMDCLER